MPFKAMRLRQAAAGGSWVTTSDFVMAGRSSGWANYTLRQVTPSSAVVSGSKIRVTFRGASSGANLVVAAAYVGIMAASGDTYDYASTPTQITVSGSPGFSVPINTDVLSDEIPFAMSSGQRLVFGVNCTSGDMGIMTPGSSDWIKYEKSGADAATVDASGYTSITPNGLFLVRKIEVWVP